MNAPTPVPTGPWSQLYAALFGVASGLAAAYGLAVILSGARGAFGYGIDIAAGLAGLCGVIVTGVDLRRESRERRQRLRRPALAKGLPAVLALILAAVTVLLAMFVGVFTLIPDARPAFRILFGAIALYLLAIAIHLHDESEH